ncbi:cation transporter [Paenarthrobacter nitroguajacolicus]|uniref:cation transporter n=1 Tax=Paenarthrobacter nitroguajacolicus TaxID=211146 RepID=UPI003AE7E5FC
MGIGLILSAVSLKASYVSAAGPTRRFPFGRDALTPLVVLIQGIAVAATLLVATGDAVLVFRDGGSPVSPVIIAIYGAATAAIGFMVAWWMRRAAPGSDGTEALHLSLWAWTSGPSWRSRPPPNSSNRGNSRPL